MGLVEKTESAKPYTEELRELSPAEHRELRMFEAENKGLAERMAAGLNRAVMREDMDGIRGV
jgi:hypothetical protein